MNGYRNWHYHDSNKLKKLFKEVVAPSLKEVRFSDKIGLEFVVYYKDKRKRDRANITSIIEKFFCDALSELGCIEDDNDSIIQYSIHRTGGIDKENPRCEVTLIDLSSSPVLSDTSQLSLLE